MNISVMRKQGIPRGTVPYLVAVVLIGLVLVVYWQVGGYKFTNLDDDQYVSENGAVLDGLTWKGVSWAFTTFEVSNWHPLTWLSHMLDVELFGADPGWHHRMNVLFHVLNTGLLFLLLWRMTAGLWQSAFVAALFGVHPLHVESVAWIAERKDVLSTFFWLLTMGAYLRYVRRPSLGRYLVVVVSFSLGLMCKPMLVTLPFVLLLMDWWPLGRMAPDGRSNVPPWNISWTALSRRACEKIPLLAISSISGAVTYLAQSSGSSVQISEQLSLTLRLSNAVVSYMTYLGKTVWPSSLAVFYPHPAAIGKAIPVWQIAGAVLLLCGITIMAVWQRHRPYLAVGWLWYIGTLVPVIGLVQIGDQALADRYTYVPLIGVFIAVAWGIPESIAGRLRRPLVLGATAGAVVVAFTLTAWSQTRYWRDTETLFSRALAVTDKNWLASNNLGFYYLNAGRPQEAVPRFVEALRIRPQHYIGWNNLGLAYYNLGQPQRSLAYYREAIRRKPDFFEPWFNLGVAYDMLGRRQEAIPYYRVAVQINPGDATAWIKLGKAYASVGLIREATACYENAARSNPGRP